MQRRSLLGLLLLLLPPFCIGEHWLMQGDFIEEPEARQRGLTLASTNSTTSVSGSMRLVFASAPGHRISCVLAAALRMNGHVELLSGGPGTDSVGLGYESIAGQPDLLFVQIESYAEGRQASRPSLGLGIAENERVALVYDGMRDWVTQDGPGNDTTPN